MPPKRRRRAGSTPLKPLGADEVCSIIRDTNTASQQVALRNGMHKADRMVKHYRGVDMPHDRYVVSRTSLLEKQ